MRQKKTRSEHIHWTALIEVNLCSDLIYIKFIFHLVFYLSSAHDNIENMCVTTMNTIH